MTHQGVAGGELYASDSRTPRVGSDRNICGVTPDFVMPYFLTDNYTHMSFIAYSSLLLRCHILAILVPSRDFQYHYTPLQG
jgi:hypothetical protein